MPRIITFTIGDKVQLKHSVAIDATRGNLSHHPGWVQGLICKSDLTGLLGTIVSFQDKSTTNKVRGKQYCSKILVRYETPVFAQSRYRMVYGLPDGYDIDEYYSTTNPHLIMLTHEFRLSLYDLLLAKLELQYLTQRHFLITKVHIEDVKFEISHLKANYLKREALWDKDQLVSAYDNVIEAIESLISAERNLPTGDATYESAMQIVLSSLIKLRCNANSGHPSSVDFAYAPEWANHCAIDSPSIDHAGVRHPGVEHWYQNEPTFCNTTGEWNPSENDERGIKRTGRTFEGLQSYDNTLVSRFIK